MRQMPSATDSTVPTSVSSALAGVEALDPALEDRGDLVGLDLHVVSAPWSQAARGPTPARLAFEVVRVGCGSTRRGSSCRPAARSRRGCRGRRRARARSRGRPARRSARRACLTVAVVELDRAGDLHRQQPVRLVPQRVEVGADAEDRRHPVALDQRLEEVHRSAGSASLTARSQPVLLLLGREVRREEEHRELAVVVHRVGERAELLADLVERVVLGRRPRTARARRPGRSPPSPTLSLLGPGASALKSSSDSASSTRRRWSSSVSVLRVTFSVASTVRSATSRRISWIARRVSASMSRRVCSISCSRWALASSWASRSWRLGGCVPGRRSRRPARGPPSAARGTRRGARRPRCGCARRASIDSSIARWRLSSASRDPREDELAQDEQRDAEHAAASRPSAPRWG